MITHQYDKDGHTYDHIEIRTYPQSLPSKEEAQKELYDSVFGMISGNRWDEIIWRVYPEFNHQVDFINHTKGWCGYARFSAKRAA